MFFFFKVHVWDFLALVLLSSCLDTFWKIFLSFLLLLLNYYDSWKEFKDITVNQREKSAGHPGNTPSADCWGPFLKASQPSSSHTPLNIPAGWWWKTSFFVPCLPRNPWITPDVTFNWYLYLLSRWIEYIPVEFKLLVVEQKTLLHNQLQARLPVDKVAPLLN